MSSPADQSRYQVRFEWGADGLDRVAASDVVVVVDVLRFSSTIAARVADGERVPLDAGAHAVSRNGAAIAARAAGARSADPAGEATPLVVLGALVNAGAIADAILAEQRRRGARTSVAVIAAGELESGRAEPGRPGESLRFAVEDLLGAGAVVDALSARGLDHTSPEAAAACEAFRGLRGAVRHLLTASGSGQELIDGGAREEVLAAAELDARASAPVLRGGVFVAY